MCISTLEPFFSIYLTRSEAIAKSKFDSSHYKQAFEIKKWNDSFGNPGRLPMYPRSHHVQSIVLLFISTDAHGLLWIDVSI